VKAGFADLPNLFIAACLDIIYSILSIILIRYGHKNKFKVIK